MEMRAEFAGIQAAASTDRSNVSRSLGHRILRADDNFADSFADIRADYMVYDDYRAACML